MFGRIWKKRTKPDMESNETYYKLYVESLTGSWWKRECVGTLNECKMTAERIDKTKLEFENIKNWTLRARGAHGFYFIYKAEKDEYGLGAGRLMAPYPGG